MRRMWLQVVRRLPLDPRARKWGCCWCLVAKSCPTLCNLMGCSLPGSSVHGILQARILKWIAFSFSSVSSWPRDRTHISYIGRQILYHCAIREARKWDSWVLYADGSWLQSPQPFPSRMLSLLICPIDPWRARLWEQVCHLVTACLLCSEIFVSFKKFFLKQEPLLLLLAPCQKVCFLKCSAVRLHPDFIPGYPGPTSQ